MFRDQFNENRFVAAFEKMADALETITRQRTELPTPTQTFEDVKALSRAGRVIDAIKLFRELTHASLKDSKDVVDSLRRF